MTLPSDRINELMSAAVETGEVSQCIEVCTNIPPHALNSCIHQICKDIQENYQKKLDIIIKYLDEWYQSQSR